MGMIINFICVWEPKVTQSGTTGTSRMKAYESRVVCN